MRWFTPGKDGVAALEVSVSNTSSNDKEKIWDAWLNGDSIQQISFYQELPLRQVKAILADEPPESILKDGRYQRNCLAFWVAADPLIMVFSPRKYTSAVLRKALSDIRRRERVLGTEIIPHILEGVEVDVAIRMVENRGVRAYHFDNDGEVGLGIPEVTQTLPNPGI